MIDVLKLYLWHFSSLNSKIYFSIHLTQVFYIPFSVIKFIFQNLCYLQYRYLEFSPNTSGFIVRSYHLTHSFLFSRPLLFCIVLQTIEYFVLYHDLLHTCCGNTTIGFFLSIYYFQHFFWICTCTHTLQSYLMDSSSVPLTYFVIISWTLINLLGSHK